MSESGDKYKIQIVKTGIGDPFLLVNFKFVTEGGLNPETNPIQSLEAHFQLSDTDHFSSSDGELAFVVAKEVSSTGPYRIGVPFDAPPTYRDGQPAFLRVYVFVNGNFDNVEFVNPEDQPGITMQNNEVHIALHTDEGALKEFYDNVYYSWPH